MSAQPVDVLAVMRAARARLEVSGAPRYAERVGLAHDAMGEVIDALREAMAYEDGQSSMCWADILIKGRAALARVQGGQQA